MLVSGDGELLTEELPNDTWAGLLYSHDVPVPVEGDGDAEDVSYGTGVRVESKAPVDQGASDTLDPIKLVAGDALEDEYVTFDIAL